MLTPQSIVQIVIGIVSLMMGYSLFRSLLPVWGFILGGWVAFSIAPSVIPGGAGQSLLVQAIAFVIGGIIGAAISSTLYLVIVFLSGAVLGVIIGTVIGAFFDLGGFSTFQQLNVFLAHVFPPIPGSTAEYLFALLGALLLGAAAINFQKFMIIASSSFLGAAAILTGLTVVIAQSAQSAGTRTAIMMFGMILLGLLGIFIQFRMGGEI